jgi:hypothetical protein
MSQPMDVNKVKELKQRLVLDTELARFWDYFLSDFAENASFCEMGRKCENKTVEELIGVVGRQLFSQDTVAISDLQLVEIPELQLIHGACLLEGKMTGLLYFPQNKAGVVAVCMDMGGRMVFARITKTHLQNLKPASQQVQ